MMAKLRQMMDDPPRRGGGPRAPGPFASTKPKPLAPLYASRPDLATTMLRRARNLIRMRDLLGMTAPDFADKVGIDKPSYYNLERGSRAITLRFLDQFAPAFGMTSAQLLAELDRE